MTAETHDDYSSDKKRQEVTLPSEGPPRTTAAPADELGSLARELARAYDELIASYRRSWGIDAAEAIEKAHTPRDRALEMAQTDPPDQLSWHTLSMVMEHDPGAGLAAWERIKDAARRELRSGHRTAQSLEWGGTPWDRARFVAIHDALREDWQPRGGIESVMVDLLAQNLNVYLRWTERLTMSAESQCRSEDVKLKQEGYWMPPRVSEANWLRWCADQAEAAHRRFLATLKTLQELRRLPGVTITTAAQVNIGQQQVNLARNEPRDR
jgi:hypothetical protein